jgi:catabolite repression HPr-like protein
MIQKSIQIKLETGLEARPVAMLVQVASQFESSVYINADDKKVNAKSIMGMMSLGLDSGSEVMVVANGSDEEAAVTEIETFLSGRTAS